MRHLASRSSRARRRVARSRIWQRPRGGIRPDRSRPECARPSRARLARRALRGSPRDAAALHSARRDPLHGVLRKVGSRFFPPLPAQAGSEPRQSGTESRTGRTQTPVAGGAHRCCCRLGGGQLHRRKRDDHVGEKTRQLAPMAKEGSDERHEKSVAGKRGGEMGEVYRKRYNELRRSHPPAGVERGSGEEEASQADRHADNKLRTDNYTLARARRRSHRRCAR